MKSAGAARLLVPEPYPALSCNINCADCLVIAKVPEGHAGHSLFKLGCCFSLSMLQVRFVIALEEALVQPCNI